MAFFIDYSINQTYNRHWSIIKINIRRIVMHCWKHFFSSTTTKTDMISSGYRLYSFTIYGLLHFKACGDLLDVDSSLFFRKPLVLNHTTWVFWLCVVTSSWFEAVGLLSQWSVCADPTLLITRALNAKPRVCCMSINLSQEGSSHSLRRHVCVNFENHVVVRRLCTELT